MSKIINIGRSQQNDIIIDEDYISSQHAQIIVDDENNLFINDLNSKNGTYLNGEKVLFPTKFQFGDIIIIGGSQLNWEPYLISNNIHVSPQKNRKTKSNVKSFGIGLVSAVVIVACFIIFNEVIGNSVSKNKDSKQTSDNKTKEDGEEGSDKDKKSDEITYDFSCVVSDQNKESSEVTDALDEMRNGVIEASGVTVTVEEEMEFGNDNHTQFLDGAEIINDERSYKLESILRKLEKFIPNPKGFTYQIFLIGSDQINAWTCGGRIYFTTKMYEFVETDDEIAGIIGHEINHNELGHINKMLRAQKISEKTFGPDFGGIAATIDGILRSPFGKKDEAHCDFKGADLCLKADFNTCDIVTLWNRMSEQEESSDALTEFISSHPLSSQRRDCLKNHLKTNYDISCD